MRPEGSKADALSFASIVCPPHGLLRLHFITILEKGEEVCKNNLDFDWNFGWISLNIVVLPMFLWF